VANLNYLAILAATVAAFVVSGVWYALFGNRLARLNDVYAAGRQSPGWTILAELVRNLVVAGVFAWLSAQLDVVGWVSAAGLALVAWVGFPAMILAGSVIHEKVPWQLAAIHVGDWLVKLLVIALIVGLWR
jgi:Protein of unknown function (DUF1761)